MNCPKCGFEQPDQAVCLSCGIVFAKYRPDAHPPEAPARPAHDVSAPSAFAQPAGRIGRLLRLGAALLCAINAAIMWLNGSAKATFAIYVALVFFVVACAHLLLTIRQRVTLRQLTIELAVVAAVSLGAKFSYPQIFDLDEPTTQGTPPPRVRGEYAAFLEATRAFDATARALVLGSPTLADTWAEQRSRLDGLSVRAAYDGIPTRERVAAYEVSELVRQVAAELQPFSPVTASTPPSLPDDVKGRIGGHLATLHDERQRLERLATEASEPE